MDNKRLDEAVEVALRAYYEDGAIVCENPALKKDMRAALLASLPVLLGPVAVWQFQGRDGEWCNFVNEQHRINAIEDGSWPIRGLYAPSLGEGDGR